MRIRGHEVCDVRYVESLNRKGPNYPASANQTFFIIPNLQDRRVLLPSDELPLCTSTDRMKTLQFPK